MVKNVNQKEYDEFVEKVASQQAKVDEKVFRTAKSGELVRRALFAENTTKWNSEWSYICENVSELYGECFTFSIDENGNEDSELDPEMKDELIRDIFGLNPDVEISFKLNKLFWGMMAEAQLLKLKSELEEMTVEEENSSPSSSSLEDYNTSSDCSEDDIEDLKSSKTKKED